MEITTFFGWAGSGGCIVDGGLVGRRAHSSSTAPRSPFSGRRRQRRGAVVDIVDGKSAGRKACGSSRRRPLQGESESRYEDGRLVEKQACKSGRPMVARGEKEVVLLTEGRWEKGRTPHPPRSGPPVSLRLGHTRALSLPRSEIQSPRAASLPAGEGKGGERWLYC